MARFKPSGLMIGVGAVLLLLLIFLLWFAGTYNGLISAREGVDGAWANVETQYQRRADLVPNLVQTVAGFAQQERTVFTEVTEARAQVGRIQLTGEDLEDPAKLQAFQAAQNQLSGALSRLIAVAENYPQLRSSENFLALQNELEGTENRIAVARRDFNDATRAYNVRVQRFPSNFVANMFGFDKRAYFESQEGSEQAPTVTKDQFQ